MFAVKQYRNYLEANYLKLPPSTAKSALTDAVYKFKCFRFKRQVLWQDNRMLIGSCLHFSQIATRCVSGEVYV